MNDIMGLQKLDNVMNKNLFKRWVPLENIPNEIYLEELYQIDGNLILRLKGSDEEGDILEVVFDAALVYRNIDEGDLLFYNRLDEEDNFETWGFFIIEDSDYLAWFELTSQGIYKGKVINHYAIYTPNDCLDILSVYPPQVQWIH